MTEIELAWLAGIIEGEGCFHFSHTPQIIVQMTDEDIVKRVADLFGKHYRTSKPREYQKKLVYTTELHSDKALALMDKLYPFMGIRRRAKIDEIRVMCANRPGQAYGERCGSSRLTDAQAIEIARTHIKGERFTNRSTSALAKKYNVSMAAIWYAVNRRVTAINKR
jgi:hypothetical protein